MADHGLWLLEDHPDTYDHLATAAVVDGSNRIVNLSELDDALDELRYVDGHYQTRPPVLPAGFIKPILSLPPLDFEPDFFSKNRHTFVSSRFRDALAQPPGVVQYWPVELIRASEEARAQDYRLFRVLATQPAMDLERSICKQKIVTNRGTGDKILHVSQIDRFVTRHDLVPATDIFCAAEHPSSVLVTDALAERVLRAECDGMIFREPETLSLFGPDPCRIRTLEGIVVR